MKQIKHSILNNNCIIIIIIIIIIILQYFNLALQFDHDTTQGYLKGPVCKNNDSVQGLHVGFFMHKSL